jgi:Ca-activated chloride channel family protein
MARVTVVQEIQNTAPDKIEAVYVFPLPHMAAVDRMDMYVGDRHIKGDIKRREEARAIYDAARDAGKMAALLDQERPNIFTQHVANIRAGEKVRIEISYVERLKYEDGEYEWTFPMVVGPRYIPGTPTGKAGGGWSYDTDRVPDASKITPPVAKPGTRAGHDLSLSVNIDAGVPLQNLASKTHEVLTERPASQRALVRLKDKDVIPNKDFILRYDVSGAKIEDALLTHRGARGGFFTLILQPPDKPNVEDITPKELVFVLDTSGSMSGFPIEKAKETMKLALEGLNPRDTFNLSTFAGDTQILFPQPVAATRENLRTAQEFLALRRGGGGTEMMKAITAALAPASNRHMRVVCFMTDGYVGNETEIIREIQKYSGARVFSFGIGSSVNRYLLDKMAEAGRGEVEYVSLTDDGSAAARRFHERVRSPLLTDISVDWGDLPIADVYPKRIPDVFSAKPIVITGRYTGPAKRNIKLHATYAGRSVTRDIMMDLPAAEPKHDVLATLWARTRVDMLMHDQGSNREEITQLGLNYRMMTPFTSFVAVEEMVVTDGGKPRRVDVPVEIPHGVSYDGVFGSGEGDQKLTAFAAPGQMRLSATPGFAAGAVANRQKLAMPSAPPVPAGKAVTEAASMRDEARRELKIDPALLKKTGKVLVQVWLVDASEATLAKLKGLGFETTVKPGAMKMVIGRIDAANLKALSELAAVKYVAPAPVSR